MPRIRNLLVPTGLGALIAIVVVFAGVSTRPAADHTLPVAVAAPSTTTSTTTTTTTSTSATTSTTATSGTSTSATPAATGAAVTDARGYVNSTARCHEGETAVAFGRTQRSQVVICADADGDYEYHGVRTSDNATLTTKAELTGAGYVAATDGATYTVSPAELEVVSGGKVIYRDTWIDYQQPRFPADDSNAATETTPTPTTTTTPTATASSGSGR